MLKKRLCFSPSYAKQGRLNLSANKKIAGVALVVFVLDQLTKLFVLKSLDYAEEKVIIQGFFKFVHWTNTGAAWSMFHDNNKLLAVIALVALFVLFLVRHKFDIHTTLGWVSVSFLFGGIAGNLLDRFLRHHVVDFLYFYVRRSSGEEIGFPAFNVADSAICVGVFLLFVLSFQKENGPAPVAASETHPNEEPFNTA